MQYANCERWNVFVEGGIIKMRKKNLNRKLGINSSGDGTIIF